MKIANWRMEQMIDVLGKYTNETGKIGYAVARNLQTLKNAAMPYFETRQKMFMKYGHPTEGEEDHYVVDDPEKVPEFATKMDEINRIECEVDIYQISEDVFISWNLPAAEMELLIWMVKE